MPGVHTRTPRIMTHPPGFAPDGDGDGDGDGEADGDGRADGAGVGERAGDGAGAEPAGGLDGVLGRPGPGLADDPPGADGIAAAGRTGLRCRAGAPCGWRAGVVLRTGGRAGAGEAGWCGTGVRKIAAVEPPAASAVAAVARAAGFARSARAPPRSTCWSAASSATPTGGSPASHRPRRDARIACRTAARRHVASSASET